jgi:hypothetical protein
MIVNMPFIRKTCCVDTSISKSLEGLARADHSFPQMSEIVNRAIYETLLMFSESYYNVVWDM